MKKYSAIIYVAFSLCVSCAKASWEGSYFCEIDLGKTTADQSVIVEYDWELGDKKCLITIAGYQMAETIKCETKTTNQGIGIYFVSYGDGALKNIYGVEQYKPGEMLFQVEENANGIITRWGSLWPGKPIEKSGVCFTKES